MPWTDIPDFTVGQVLTSTRMNQMRNNANIGHRICTSSTRPASPDEGTMIYETDTDKVYVWTGAAWLESMTANTRATTTQMPAGAIVQVARYAWTTQTSVNNASSGWVAATSSSTSFTPLFSDSRIWIVGEFAMAPYSAGADAGMSARIIWRGAVVTNQSATAGHEVYTYSGSSNADLYSRTIKTAWTTAGGTTAGTISTEIRAYSVTQQARLNQASQWESSYTVLEVRQ